MDSNSSFYPFKADIAKTRWYLSNIITISTQRLKISNQKIKLQQTWHGVYVAQANIHPELESQFQ